VQLVGWVRFPVGPYRKLDKGDCLVLGVNGRVQGNRSQAEMGSQTTRNISERSAKSEHKRTRKSDFVATK